MDSAARILIVDDDKNLTLLISRFLKQASGYQVRAINRPQEAMDAAKEFRPDLILLDWDMPGMRGEEVLSELRRCEQTSSTKVALFTGALRGNSENAEGTWFLPKPIAMTKLLANVHEILQ